ncbi:hypothetical protein [Moraxella lacunata]|uniref:hypothetical protein n=1 Tax=Moraxella lacunata TaxID=477 RepID=UPI003EE39A5D
MISRLSPVVSVTIKSSPMPVGVMVRTGVASPIWRRVCLMSWSSLAVMGAGVWAVLGRLTVAVVMARLRASSVLNVFMVYPKIIWHRLYPKI